jgi:formylglycine-generating enzyme required for sulfatase activity
MFGNGWRIAGTTIILARLEMVRPGQPEIAAGVFLRGGSWDDLLRYLRAAVRDISSPGIRGGNCGIRVARTLHP